MTTSLQWPYKITQLQINAVCFINSIFVLLIFFFTPFSFSFGINLSQFSLQMGFLVKFQKLQSHLVLMMLNLLVFKNSLSPSQCFQILFVALLMETIHYFLFSVVVETLILVHQKISHLNLELISLLLLKIFVLVLILILM